MPRYPNRTTVPLYHKAECPYNVFFWQILDGKYSERSHKSLSTLEKDAGCSAVSVSDSIWSHTLTSLGMTDKRCWRSEKKKKHHMDTKPGVLLHFLFVRIEFIVKKLSSSQGIGTGIETFLTIPSPTADSYTFCFS